MALAAGFGLLGLIVSVALTRSSRTDDAAPDPIATTTTIAEQTTSTPSTTEPADNSSETVQPDEPVPVAPTIEQLARATVQILVADEDGRPSCSGSGSIVTAGGRILTNFHVIDPQPPCEHDQILIGVIDRADQVPEVVYRADVLAVDPALDLAVLQIAESVNGEPMAASFPFIELGDSDAVDLGDRIRVLGYPGIGGETITFTDGSISGFTQDPAAGTVDRGWIKTDATIAGGNSGGAAIDDDGRLIGVPTQVSAGEGSEVADCRVLVDTNGDGSVDDDDQCVPIGGFINGIRPIALAAGLFAEADGATPQRVWERSTPVPGSDWSPSDAVFYRPIFSTGIDTAGFPVDDLAIVQAGAAELCFSADWIDMADGVRWSALWFVDGDLVEDYSLVDQLWDFGADGEGFWVCAQDDGGIPDGGWEVLIAVDDEPLFGESITVAADPVSGSTEVELRNDTGAEICFLLWSHDWASYYGLDELDDDTLPAGASTTVRMAAGAVDLRAVTCDDGERFDFSVDVGTSPQVISIS